MEQDDWRKRISINPMVCHGRPVIAGTRIWVSNILGLLAGGETVETLLKTYPYITREDIQACLAYGAAMTDWEEVDVVEIVMKIKLDENLSPEIALIFQTAGHDVETVYSEGLVGLADPQLLEVCAKEGRCLITNDKGIGNVGIYPPENYAGIVVVRFPDQKTIHHHFEAAMVLANRLPADGLFGKLWVLHQGKIRTFGGKKGEEE